MQRVAERVYRGYAECVQRVAEGVQRVCRGCADRGCIGCVEDVLRVCRGCAEVLLLVGQGSVESVPRIF